MPLINRWAAGAVLIGSVGLAGLVAFTASHGCATSPDSAGYLAGAISLRYSHSYSGLDGRPLADWPPVYSLLLAVCSTLAPLTPAGAPRILGALLYLLALWASWRLLRTSLVRPAVQLACFSLIAFSSTLLLYMGALLSEGLFILWTVLFLLLACTGRPEGWRLFGLAALAATATLTRYAGIAFYPLLAVLWLLRRPVPFRWNWRHGLELAAAAVTGLPVLAFFLRNLRLTGSLTGPRGPAVTGTLENLRGGLDVISQFLLPARLPLELRLIVLALLAAGVVWTLARTRTASENRPRLLPLLAAGWCAIYFLLLTLLASVGYMDAFDFRLMSPLLLPFLLALAWTSDAVLERIPRRAVRLVVLAAAAGLVLFSVQRCAALVRTSWRQGPGMYTNSEWRNDPLVRQCKQGLPDGRWFSNAADALFLNTLRPFVLAPTPERIPDWLAQVRSAPRPAYLAWRDGFWRTYPATPEQLAAHATLTPLQRLGPWTLYQITP